MDLGLSKSLHERLMYDCQYPHIMLDMQYRMSCQISSFPSRHFYDSKIGNGLNVISKCYLEGPSLLDKIPYIFQQIEGREENSASGSWCNRAEAQKIVELVDHLQQTAQSRQESTPWYSADRIRIISFYQAQVALIQRLLCERGLEHRQVLVATVDSSQGCEADRVLISFVRSPSPQNPSPSAGFLTDNRRLNVALTRARYQLVCVANIRSFHRFVGDDAEALRQLATDAEDRGVIRTPLVPIAASNIDRFYGPPNKKKKKNRRM